ncbi:hypothetical protein M426DRAFT_74938 [Hypoxylon sp. CI-4A]|nr:hypothetical protein M426DRAFT_74938 [Hypoxylon sp. CI-4A]
MPPLMIRGAPAKPAVAPNANAKAKSRPSPTSSPASSSSSSPSSSSSSSGGYEDKRQPMSDLVRSRWFPLFGAGAAAACVGLFTASFAYYWRRPAERWTPGEEPETPTGRPTIQSPREFDQHLDKSEWRFGITKLRRRIASEMARGHVLEVAVGAGRNFDYYDWSVITEGLETPEEMKKKKTGWFNWSGKGEEDGEKGGAKPSSPQPQSQPKKENAILSFTGVDIAPSMLDLALTRIRQVVPHTSTQIPKKPSFGALSSSSRTEGGQEGISLANNRLRILSADAQTSLPAPPSPSSSPSTTPRKYDTIIQTFGLCSVRDPVRLLATMAAALEPETGRIILLEHGRSSSTWETVVNGLLDRGARQHFERFGCWWNRDVELVVRAAERAVPGLEVLRLERPGWVTLGTHVLVEMRDDEKDESSKSAASWWPSVLSVGTSGKPKKDD